MSYIKNQPKHCSDSSSSCSWAPKRGPLARDCLDLASPSYLEKNNIKSSDIREFICGRLPTYIDNVHNSFKQKSYVSKEKALNVLDRIEEMVREIVGSKGNGV